MTDDTTGAEQRIDAILAAAAEEFFAKGFAGARVDEIARRVGLNKAMLYYYVGNKEALLARVLTRTLEDAHSRIAAAVAAVDGPEARLRAVVGAFVAEATDNSHLLVLLREVMAGGGRLPDEVLARLPPVALETFRVLDEGEARGVFRRVNPLLVHLMVAASAVFLTVARPIRERLAASGGVPEALRMEPEEVPDLVSDVLLYGVAVREGATR
jgi:AcrR family transcriptional regulator